MTNKLAQRLAFSCQFSSVSGLSSPMKGSLGGVLYIAEKVTWRVTNRGKWLLGGVHFFETVTYGATSGDVLIAEN